MGERSDGLFVQRALDEMTGIAGRVHCHAHFISHPGCVGEVSFDDLLSNTSIDQRGALLDRIAVLCLATMEATSVPRALLPGAHAPPSQPPPVPTTRCGRRMATANAAAITALCDHSRELHRRLAETNNKWVSANENIRELQAAVVAAKEENALFKEVLRSIDPRTGKEMLATDPGSIDQAHEQWTRLFRQIGAAARARGDRDVPNRGGKRDACTDAQDPLPVAACRECAHMRAAVFKIHAAIARLAGIEKSSLDDCSENCTSFLLEHVESLDMLHADRLRAAELAQQATELEAACRARIAAADEMQARACEEVRMALTTDYEQRIQELNAIIAKEREEQARLNDIIATRDKTIKTLTTHRENDRKAAELLAANNARTQQANLERVLLLQRDLVSARTNAETEGRRAAVAESQNMDLKAQVARLQGELATVSSSLSAAREAAEKNEREVKHALEKAARDMKEQSVTVTRLTDQCAALADHTRVLDDQVRTLEEALARSQAEVAARVEESVQAGQQLRQTQSTCSTLADQAQHTQQQHEATLVNLTAAEARIAELEELLRNTSLAAPEAWSTVKPVLPTPRPPLDLDSTLQAADFTMESDDAASMTSRSSLGADYEHVPPYQLDQPTPLWKARPPSDPPQPPPSAVKAHPPPKSAQREERRAVIRRFLAQRTADS